MRLWLLASSFLILASASANAGSGPALRQPSDGPGLWSRAANLATGREEHTATLLPNGKILVAGGTDGRGKVLASAELYDPARNRWTSARSMAATRIDQTATLLPSGKVLVAGGVVMPYPAPSLASAELYDPSTNAWSMAAPMIESRTRHTATLLPDGRVLVVGGQRFDFHDGGLFPGRPTDAEIYDPTANRWAPTASMGASRLAQTATQLPDGRVLITGGLDADGVALKSTEIYNAQQDRWISAAPMAIARSGHVATLMANGDVLVATGLGEEPSRLTISLSSAEIYDPRTNLWVSVASMAEFRVAVSATLLRNGMVLVVGASGQSRPELYDPAQDRWFRTGPSMDRYQHTATRLPDGRVLIVGGYGIESLASALIYDPEGVSPAPVRPPDPRVIAALLMTAVLVVAAIAWSTPAVRRRVRQWRPPAEPDEWIA
jgi:Kelch motif/Galactose oxidase, central domain